MRNAITLGLVLLFLLPAAAFADTTMHFALQKPGGAGRSTVYVRPGEVRSNNSHGTWMLYKAGSNTLYVVQPKSKSYIRVDRDKIRRLGKRMAQARKRYRAELKKVPPKQREKIEKSIGPMLRSPAQRQPLRLHTGGATHRVGGVACRSGRISQGGKVLQRICIAEPAALGMSRKEFESLKGLYRLMADLDATTGFGPGPMPDLGRLDGVPISLRSARGGESQRLTTVNHKKLSASLFALPSGYKEASGI